MDDIIRQNALLILATAAVVIIGLTAITYVRRTMRAVEVDRDDDLLTDLQRAYIKGQMDEKEFLRVQESLEKQKRAEKLLADHPAEGLAEVATEPHAPITESTPPPAV